MCFISIITPSAHAIRHIPCATTEPPKPLPSGKTISTNLPIPLFPLSVGASFITGYVTLPALSAYLSPLSPPQALITGAFMPISGILFATFATTAVSVLHTRQINLRSALMTELANVRLLQTLLLDGGLRDLLREYVECIKRETFHQAEDLETAYELSERVLWTCVRKANEQRLRNEVESLLHELVTLRERRRALVEACLPGIHFVITGLLGICLLLGFVFLIPEATTTARLLFGLMATMLALSFWLLGDLQGEWGGEYRVDAAWMNRTERFIS